MIDYIIIKFQFASKYLIKMINFVIEYFFFLFNTVNTGKRKCLRALLIVVGVDRGSSKSCLRILAFTRLTVDLTNKVRVS